ncbi:MAG: hypothetical protein IPH03_10740 [Tetrasphaera sp.]|nr:hypothetical protein [Tetrasphaera sp.]
MATYIGLAAMIFINWRPGGLLAGSALFGYTDAIRLRGGERPRRLAPGRRALVIVALWRMCGAGGVWSGHLLTSPSRP